MHFRFRVRGWLALRGRVRGRSVVSGSLPLLADAAVSVSNGARVVLRPVAPEEYTDDENDENDEERDEDKRNADSETDRQTAHMRGEEEGGIKAYMVAVINAYYGLQHVR